MHPKHEIAELLHHHEKDFLKTHRASKQVLRTFHAIKVCRTKHLGGHKKQCNACGHIEISYNSCRNRHCPKCQAVNRERWIKQREAELLSVPYFHVVFTLPHEFNTLVVRHPKEIYNTLFKASWKTIQQFASDSKHLGAKTGMTAVLHTWGQNLSLHPHVHCIVAGGGIDEKGCWRLPKKSARKSLRNVKYLFPKKALSKVYRAKFMACLREEMQIPQSIAKAVIHKEWVVYAKRPFLGPKQVIEYLGRYTHKIAISNHRILSIKSGKVSFQYKDYRTLGVNKVMTISAVEFIRRYAQHVLPHGFTRMRHYGILASKNKAIDLNKAKTYFKLPHWKKQKISWSLIAEERLKIQLNRCEKCKGNTLETVQVIEPQRGPPFKILTPNVNF